MRELYKDRERWDAELHRRGFPEHDTAPRHRTFLTISTPGHIFSEMDDEAFINSVNALPIFMCSSDEIDFRFSPYSPNQEIFRFRHCQLPVRAGAFSRLFRDRLRPARGNASRSLRMSARTLREGSLSIISPNSKHSISICNDECCAVRFCLNTNIFDKTFFDILSPNTLLSTFFYLGHLRRFAAELSAVRHGPG